MLDTPTITRETGAARVRCSPCATVKEAWQ
jgi:hypothetical protein